MRELILRSTPAADAHLHKCNAVWRDILTSMERHKRVVPSATDAVPGYTTDHTWTPLLTAMEELWDRSSSYAEIRGAERHGVWYAIKGTDILSENPRSTASEAYLHGIPGPLEVLSDSHSNWHWSVRFSGLTLVCRGVAADSGETIRVVMPGHSD